MYVIGVIDLRGGLAVHANGGRRESYDPVTAVGATAIEPGNALNLAHAYADLGVGELYVADLDAIGRHASRARVVGAAAHPAANDDLVSAIIRVGLPVWLDAGVSAAPDAGRAIALGARHVVVGLETLSSYDALEDIRAAAGRDRVAFSLDLRGGTPVRTPADTLATDTGGASPTSAAATVAARAAATGVASIIVLDLARVGSCAGLDEPLLTEVRHAAPSVELIVGGGVRGPDDLDALTRLGYDGALVATAVLSGTLTAHDIAHVRRA